MRVGIAGLSELRARLASIRAEELLARTLAEQAERMAQSVRELLSGVPGSGGHDQPWLETGALRDSIRSNAEGLEAVVGSSDPAAAPQELGTVKMAPRPFLAPVAVAMGEEVAQAIGAAVVGALRDGAGDTGGADTADLSSDDLLCDNVSMTGLQKAIRRSYK